MVEEDDEYNHVFKSLEDTIRIYRLRKFLKLLGMKVIWQR